MRPYRFASPALQDLREILAFLAGHSTVAGAQFLKALDQRLRLVARYPRMGMQKPEFGYPHLRFLVLQHYVIAYDPEATPIVVLAIRHGSRAPGSMLRDNL